MSRTPLHPLSVSRWFVALSITHAAAGCDTADTDGEPDVTAVPDVQDVSEDVAADPSIDVAAPGPVAPDIDLESVAGLQVEEVTYTVPGLDDERTVEIHLWYPTDDVEGEGATFGSPLFTDAFAWVDAAVAAPSGDAPFPLAVYSHGGFGFPGQFSTVARQFVRNGWVVVAPSHPGHALLDRSDDLPYAFPAIRAADTVAAMNYVANLPAEHALSGRVDTSEILAVGHSYGGQNAWILGGLPLDVEGLEDHCDDGCTPEDVAAYEAFSPDPRIVAGVSFETLVDTVPMQDDAFAQMPIPMLQMSGTEGTDGAPLFARAGAADLIWVSLVGGCHESFTGTLPCGTFEQDEGLRVTATYAIAFGARHVLGATDETIAGILDGSVAVSDDVEWRRSTGAE